MVDVRMMSMAPSSSPREMIAKGHRLSESCRMPSPFTECSGMAM